jgi:pilus assembly protein Flp/PilA
MHGPKYILKKRRGDREMRILKNLLNNVWRDESGQDLIEYALVAALIGLGCISAMSHLSEVLINAFTSIGNTLSTNI